MQLTLLAEGFKIVDWQPVQRIAVDDTELAESRIAFVPPGKVLPRLHARDDVCSFPARPIADSPAQLGVDLVVSNAAARLTRTRRRRRSIVLLDCLSGRP